MPLLTVRQAYETIMATVRPATTERVALSEATGRFLAEPVVADRAYPPINRATMDGIAVASRFGGRAWHIETTLPAGVPARPLHDPQTGCVQIMTGAEVPENADAVIPFEAITIEGDTARLNEGLPVAGDNIHAKGIDRQHGDVLLLPSIRLNAPRIALMAGVGHAHVTVARRPRVALISTGDEIVPVEKATVNPHETRASNLAGLAAGLTAIGLRPVMTGHAPDDRRAIEHAIQRALDDADILLVSGGVSKGRFDFVPEVLRACGVEQIFHGVAQKPGKPLWFGTHTGGQAVLGLPGNPVSTLAVFRRYVAPFVWAMQGGTIKPPTRVSLPAEVHPHPSLTLLLPATLDESSRACPVAYHGSGDFAALGATDGLVEIPPKTENAQAVFHAWDLA